MIPPTLGVAAAVMTLLSLLLVAPASADTATPVSQCSSGDRSYSSVGATSATATAPDGYRIASFCVVGRGNAGPEMHTLSTPQKTTVVSHSTGKQLESYSVTYVQIPVASAPEAADETAADEAAAEKEKAKVERTPAAQETEPEPSRSAPPAPLPSLLSDGEELQITTFDEKDDSEDRWSFVVVGGIIVVGLLAGAIALLVRLPGQR